MNMLISNKKSSFFLAGIEKNVRKAFEDSFKRLQWKDLSHHDKNFGDWKHVPLTLTKKNYSGGKLPFGISGIFYEPTRCGVISKKTSFNVVFKQIVTVRLYGWRCVLTWQTDSWEFLF